jgi:hypothetical protein
MLTNGDLLARNGSHPPMRDIPKFDPVKATGSLKEIEWATRSFNSLATSCWPNKW